MPQGTIKIKTDRLSESACIGVRQNSKGIWRPTYSRKDTYLSLIIKSLVGMKTIDYKQQEEFTIIRYSTK